MTHQDVWQPPFKVNNPYIVSSNGVTAITSWCGEDILNNICDLMNGKGGLRYAASSVMIDITYINIGWMRLVVRGWGHLTGCEGLNLPNDVAAKLQDEFRDWIVERITENKK